MKDDEINIEELENLEYKLKIGTGGGEKGNTTIRKVRVPDELWDACERLGVSRSEACRKGLLDALRRKLRSLKRKKG